MSVSLIWLTAAVALLAVLNYHLGFRLSVPFLGWWPKAAFLVFAFVLAPVCLLALWNQQQADERLSAAGVTLHPSVTNAVGIATGLGDSPTWLFEMSAPPKDVLAFYRTPEGVNDWALVSDGPMVLVFKRDTKRLTIIAGETRTSRTVAFQISDRDDTR